MKYYYIILFCLSLLLFNACNSTPINYNQEVEIVNTFEELETIIGNYKDDVLILNFWATSCPPCIKEMPHFKEIEEKYAGRGVKVLLISLDAEKDMGKRVIPFIKKHNIFPEVNLLADDNYSAWTEKIDASWYGALPATLIKSVKGSKFQFGAYEKMEDLESQLLPLM